MLLDRVRDRAQIRALHVGQHVEGGHDVVVGDVGRRRVAADVGQVAEQLRRSRPRPVRCGVLLSASSESSRYCGVCTATVYCDARWSGRASSSAHLPARGQRDQHVVGHVRAGSSPTWLARVRSTSSVQRRGMPTHCWMCTSTAPGIRRHLVARRCSAICGSFAVRKRPTNWMSMGAEMPKFRTCVDDVRRREEEGKSGKSCASACAAARTYSGVGAWSVLLQRDQDLAVGGGDERAVARARG